MKNDAYYFARKKTQKNPNYSIDIKKSLSYYNKALKIIPDEPLALFNLGTTLYDLDKYDEAIQIFDKLIKLQPKNVDAICNKANTLVALGKHNQAMSNYDKALKYYENSLSFRPYRKITQTNL